MSNNTAAIEQIKKLINEERAVPLTLKKDNDIFDQYYAPKGFVVRPSGNPMGKKTWIELANTPGVESKTEKILDIHEVHVSASEDMAWAVYTVHSQFTFKGEDQDDIAVFTGVFTKIDNAWKTSVLHRSTGRKPGVEMPNFKEY